MHINVRIMGLAVGSIMALMTFTVQARDIRYAARMDQSQWQLQASRAECVLSHEIPDYGQARFVQRPGQDAIFSMDITPEASLANTAVIRSVPPAWNHSVQGKTLSQLPVPVDATTLTLNADATQALLNALKHGLDVEVVYKSVSNRIAVISTVRALTAINDFYACAIQLSKTALTKAGKPRATKQSSVNSPAHSVALTYASVEYDGDEDTLSDVALSALTGIAREFLSQKKSSKLQVVISGNSASDVLYKRRVAMISIYLVSKGLPAAAVTTIKHGQLPKVENEPNVARPANSLQIRLVQ